jgi:hypothetical protein
MGVPGIGGIGGVPDITGTEDAPAVVKIEATGARLLLAVVVFGVAFGAVSLVEPYCGTTHRWTDNRTVSRPIGRDGIRSLARRWSIAGLCQLCGSAATKLMCEARRIAGELCALDL